MTEPTTPLNLLVCVKQVIDPDLPAQLFQADAAQKSLAKTSNLQRVISPYDEQAIEAALRIRDQHRDTKITAITVGPSTARVALKRALSLGADAAILVSDPLFDELEGQPIAAVLARAIRKQPPFHLILTGRQAADTDSGVVGPMLSELLKMNCVSFAGDIKIGPPEAFPSHVSLSVSLVVESIFNGESEFIECGLPTLVSVSHEIGLVRKASLQETMRAAKKPLTVWSAADLGITKDMLEAAKVGRVRERLFVPEVETHCQIVEGSSSIEKARALLTQLRNLELI